MNVNAALRTKKCIAMLLAVALLFQCGVFAPIPARGATSAQASGQLMLGIHPVDYHQHLRDNGDGTYTLTLTLTDGATVSAGNLNNKVSYNNYFTAPDDGDYLIQLWGGNGGNGGSTYVEGEDGVGGAGGYVYGVVTLKEGQTLYYQLGGNGYTSSSIASGGGANGPGGNAGENQEWFSGGDKPAIGGGGGYSAVYLFDKGEFEQYYLDANGNFLGTALSEDHRTSKHIMIAGGGGGGGYRADSDSSTPDGGVGGNMDTSASGATSDGGTFFSGTNGFTSGNSTAYVGEGGSDKPGAIQGTITSLYKGLQPNDWLRSYGTDTAGGSGGTGNFRGGGGGAGYAGGSGGVQTSALFGASNVGGGGGGSSYVSGLVRFGSDLTAAERAALTGIDNSPTGGYVRITALKVKDSTVLNNFSLSLSISDYFTVARTDEALEAEDGILAINGNTLTLSGINLSGNSKVFTLKFTPKSGFAGGNAVPLTANNIVTLTSGSEAAQMKLDPKCASVNVPLNLIINTYSYATEEIDVIYGTGSDQKPLYDPLVLSPGAANPMSNGFITLNDPVIKNQADEIVTLPVTPNTSGTHVYIVTYSVRLNSAAKAEVGTPVVAGQSVSSTAVVRILGKNSQDIPLEGDIGDLSVTKKLSYDHESGHYILTINVNGGFAQGTLIAAKDPTPTKGFSKEFYRESGDAKFSPTDLAEHMGVEGTFAGYYLIQVWGGDGGKGGDAQIGTAISTGGEGGRGGYLEYYIHLDAEDVLTFDYGFAGKSADNLSIAASNNAKVEPASGEAGTKSIVNLNGTRIIIAGGGGGGGAGWRNHHLVFGFIPVENGKAAYAGQSAYNMEDPNPTYTEMGSFDDRSRTPWGTKEIIGDVTSFSDASDGGFKTSPDDDHMNAGGICGSSHYNPNIGLNPEIPNNTAVSNSVEEAINDATMAHKPSDLNGAGAVKITLIALDPWDPVVDTEKVGQSIEKFNNYALSATISQYFTLIDDPETPDVIEGISISNVDLPTIAYDSAESMVSITQIMPKGNFTTTENADNSTSISGSVDYTISIELKAKEGFLGGRDVPLLLASVITPADGTAPVSLTGLGSSDYANVAIDSAALGTLLVNPNEAERTINQYTASIDQADLYQWISDWKTPSDSWEDDYVELSISVAKKGSSTSLPQDQTIRPDPLVTTVYTVTATVGPKPDRNPIDAAVVGPQDSHSISVDVEVIVVPRIHYDLTGVTTSDTPLYDNYYYGLTPGVSHIATLTAADGYDMPQSITVTDLYGNAIPDVSYNPNTGQFNIPGQYIEGTLTVTAVAKEKTYSISFWAPIGPDNELVCVKMGPSFKAGETISIPDVEALAPDYGDEVTYTIVNPDGSSTTTPAVLQPADAEHYSGIAWSPELTSLPENMPTQNIIIIGSFVANKYPLVIEYKDNAGNPLAPSVTVDVPYNEPYTASPIDISGYIPTQSSFTTTMDAAGKTIVFTYLPTSGQVIVNYTYSNGAYPNGSDTYDVVAGPPSGDSNTYDLNKAGYEIINFSCNIASYTWVNGILTVTPTEAEIADGIKVEVTYQPKNYVLTFDPNGGNVSVPTMTVQYDNLYGYDALAGRTVGLPTPVLAGYDFIGWYIGETKITDTDIVKITDDTILEARWSQRPTTVTIRFEDELGNELYAPVKSDAKAPGTSGSYDLIGTGAPGTSITKDGKTYVTREDTIINYTHGTTDIVIVVLYYAPKQLTINYRDAVTGALMDEGKFDDPNASNVYTALYYVGQEYMVQSPTATNSNYQADIAVVSGTMGTKDVVVNVLYTSTYEPPSYDITVVWNDMSFNYSYGNWDPTTHTYTPSVVPNSDNSITIRSNSTAEVNVTLSYTPYTNTQPPAGAIMDPSDPNYTDYDQYENLAGYYTAGENAQSHPITGVHLDKVDEQKVYFWLKIEDDGLPPGLENQSPIIGTCTVTIGATQSTP